MHDNLEDKFKLLLLLQSPEDNNKTHTKEKIKDFNKVNTFDIQKCFSRTKTAFSRTKTLVIHIFH